MPVINPTDLALLRTRQQKTRVYLSVHTPFEVWSATVSPKPDREAQTILFTGGSGHDFSQVQKHQTVMVIHDDGQPPDKLRILSISSGDGGATGTLVVNGNGVYWAEDTVTTLSFLYQFELHTAFPFLRGDPENPIFTKDWDQANGITYTDENEQPPPIAIAGSNRAAFLDDGGEVTLWVPTGKSYAVAPGASITGTFVTAYHPSAGVSVGGESGGYVPLTYTQPGTYWIKVQATDSNGKTQDTWRIHFIHVNNPSDPSYPHVGFTKASVSGSFDRAGWSGSLDLVDDANLDDFPGEGQCVLWQDSQYGSTQKNISAVSDSPEVVLGGWIADDQTSLNLSDGSDVALNIMNTNDLLENRFMFSISLTTEGDPDKWYQYLNGALTPGRIYHHIMRWHSTLIHITDVFGIVSNPDQRKAIDMEKANLQIIGKQVTADYGILAHAIADKAGNIRIIQDIQLTERAYRNGLPVAAELERQDNSGPMTIVHTPQKEVSFVFFSGFRYDGTTATPMGSTAPSSWPAREGASDVVVERQIVRDQNHSNEVAGQVFGLRNLEYREVRQTFVANWLGVLDFAFEEWWTTSIAQGETIRDIIWGSKQMALRQVNASIDVSEGHMTINASFQPRVDAPPGVPYLWPGFTPDLGGIPPIYEEDEFPGTIVTGASVWKLAEGTATWAEKQVNDTQDVGQDLHWRTAQGTDSPSGAILYACQEGQVLKTTDGCETWNAVNIGDPPNSFGDSPAPLLADVVFEQYETNPAIEGEHYVLANWENSGGEWRSWAVQSIDDGDTWVWLAVGGSGANAIGTSVGASMENQGRFNARISPTETLFVGTQSNNLQLAYGIQNGSVIDFTVSTIVTGGVRGGAPLASITMLGTTTFAVLYVEDATNDIKGFAGTIVGGVITTGNIITVIPGTSFALAIGRVIIRRVDNNSAIFCCWTVSPDGVYVLGLNYTGEEIDTPLGTLAHVEPSRDVLYADIASYQSGEAVCVLGDIANPTGVAVKLSIATNGTPSVSATQTFDVGSTAVNNVSITTDVDGYTLFATGAAPALIHAMHIVRTAGITIQPPQSLALNAVLLVADSDKNNTLRLGIMDTTIGIARSAMLTIARTGLNTYSVIDDVTTLATQTPSISLASPGTDTSFLYDGAQHYLIGVSSGGKGLGMAVGSGGGTLYITTATSTVLFFRSYELPSGASLLSQALGPTTPADTDDRSAWAYPFPEPFSDIDCYVIGRWDDAGQITQMIVMYDDGSWDPVITDWNVDLCGAITLSPFGELFLMRCAPNGVSQSPVLYLLDTEEGEALLQATINQLPERVNQRGMTSSFDDFLYVCSGIGNSVMVLETGWPFDFTGDITGNHSTSRGVNAIEVL